MFFAVSVVSIEQVAGDAEQVGAEARLAAKRIGSLDAGEKDELDQICGVLVGLVLQKAVDAVEVPVEQGIACLVITASPRIEKIVVGVHGPIRSCTRFGGWGNSEDRRRRHGVEGAQRRQGSSLLSAPEPRGIAAVHSRV